MSYFNLDVTYFKSVGKRCRSSWVGNLEVWMLQHICTIVVNLVAITMLGCKLSHFKENSVIYQFSLPLATSTEQFSVVYLKTCHIPRAIHQPQLSDSLWHGDGLSCKQPSIWSPSSEIYHRLSWKRGCWQWSQQAPRVYIAKPGFQMFVSFNLRLSGPVFLPCPANDPLIQSALIREVHVAYGTCFPQCWSTFSDQLANMRWKMINCSVSCKVQEVKT